MGKLPAGRWHSPFARGLAMSDIKFVYFDVGGVAIQDFSDTNKWQETATYLGVPKDKQSLFFELYNQADNDICMGHLSIDDWIRQVQDQLSIKIDQDFSFLDYFLDNFSQNTYLWPIIKMVKTKTKIGLLTDMWPNMLSKLKERSLLPPFEWDSVVNSTVEGVRKPMPEIYQIANIRAGVDKSEILFIDNRQYNLDGATKAGWHTFLYDSRDYDQANQNLHQFLSAQSLL